MTELERIQTALTMIGDAIRYLSREFFSGNEQQLTTELKLEQMDDEINKLVGMLHNRDVSMGNSFLAAGKQEGDLEACKRIGDQIATTIQKKYRGGSTNTDYYVNLFAKLRAGDSEVFSNLTSILGNILDNQFQAGVYTGSGQ